MAALSYAEFEAGGNLERARHSPLNDWMWSKDEAVIEEVRRGISNLRGNLWAAETEVATFLIENRGLIGVEANERTD